jgi:GTPase SAR1 family protein
MPISTPQTLTVPNTIENGQNSDSPTSSASSSTQTLPPLSPGSPRAIRRKLVVIGDGACGKTSLLVAYKNGTFTSDYLPTVFENSTTTVPIEDKIVDLSLWDTAGIITIFPLD